MKEESINAEVVPKKLKPVVFVKGHYDYHRQNKFQQNLLLKAMQVTTDPKELRRIIGVKTVADVYRTLDKLAIRKEYHEALLRNGIDLDSIVGGIKGLAECGEMETTRLSAYRVLLRSLGLDEYKESEVDNKKSWEDVLKEMVENNKIDKNIDKYEVVLPEIPEEEKKRLADEEEMGKSIYE